MSRLKVEGFVKDDIIHYIDLEGRRQHGLVHVRLSPRGEDGKKIKELWVRMLSRKAWYELKFLLKSLKNNNIQAHKF